VMELPIVEYTICEELHKSGEPHLHAWLKFEKAVNATRFDYYDLTDKDGTVWHGNYGAARNDMKCRKYCEKEGSFISTKVIKPLVMAVQMAQQGKAKEAFAVVCEQRPDMVLMGAERVKSSIAALAAEPEEKEEVLTFKDVPAGLAAWNRKRSTLWLYGPSGYGKTELAKSLFENALMVSHMDQLKKLGPEHDGIIFDDVSVKHWPRESAIHITDLAHKRGVNVKHGCIVIPKGKARVFCSNVPIWPDDPSGAIKRRVHCVEVKTEMFDRKDLQWVKPVDDWEEVMAAMDALPMHVGFTFKD